MNWKTLESLEDLQNAINDSNKEAIVLFKHSTRCSVSTMAKKSVEHFWDLDIDAYYLDLLAHRNVSNAIADQLSVQHASPQLILVKDGKALYHASHGQINVDDLDAYL